MRAARRDVIFLIAGTGAGGDRRPRARGPKGTTPVWAQPAASAIVPRLRHPIFYRG